MHTSQDCVIPGDSVVLRQVSAEELVDGIQPLGPNWIQQAGFVRALCF